MATLEATPAIAPGNRLREGLTDALVMTKRNMLHIPRVPELLVFSTIQPILFVLLFAYVFGGALNTGGFNAREYLLAGIFVQTIAFSTGSTAVGLAEDMTRGLIDRFKSLPMARSAVLIGRTIADLARNVFIGVIIMICGFAVGWRIRDGALKAIAALAVIYLFCYAMTWIGAMIGMVVSNPETANTAGFIWLFPVTFLSNAFVPVGTLPSWLKPVAIWNPFSSTVQAARELFGNPVLATGHSFPVEHPIVVSVGWSLLLLAVFIPWSVRKYARVTGG